MSKRKSYNTPVSHLHVIEKAVSNGRPIAEVSAKVALHGQAEDVCAAVPEGLAKQKSDEIKRYKTKIYKKDRWNIKEDSLEG